MSIVFIGTPEFAVPSLRRLAEAGYDISAVVTQPDRPGNRGRLTPPAVKVAAEELGLPVLQPETLRDEAVVDQLRSLAPEVIVLAAYGQILRKNVLDIAPKGVLNVHASLLPRWRGASPISAAILAADEETGATIMLMDAGMDTGPVLARRATPIGPHDTTGDLTARLADLGAELLIETLPRWLAAELDPQPQDESLATVTRLIRKQDGEIDWSRRATDIWRAVRAYNPWPGAQTALDGDRVTVWRAWPLAVHAGEPGTIIALPDDAPPEGAGAAFAVQTGDGALAVLELQRAGKRALSSAEFLRGAPGLIGRRFR